MAKNDDSKIRCSLNLRNIFKRMMEDGYYPVYERTHIQFGLDDNIAVLEYEEGILSIRLFFSIDEEAYDLFLEASNSMMLSTSLVKPAILDDMQNIMFSCETFCYNLRDFKRFFPAGIQLLKDSLAVHKSEMKKLLLTEEIISRTIPATDEIASMAGISKSQKVVS